MAATYTEGYRIGFEVTNKDISIKETVTIRYFLGFKSHILLMVIVVLFIRIRAAVAVLVHTPALKNICAIILGSTSRRTS